MEEYKLLLKFLNPNPVGIFSEHVRWFEKCVEKFNTIVAESRANKREIEVIEVSDDYIKIKLSSELELGQAPGKSLVKLSQSLVNDCEDELYDDFFAQNLFHGKLFTFTNVEDVGELSDTDAVKALLDYLVTPQSQIAEGKKQAFKRIKKIIIENDLTNL